MLLTISILLCGFSIFSAMVLVLSHFRNTNYPEQRQAKYMGAVLVLTLAAIQGIHFVYLYLNTSCIQTSLYQILLFAVAPAFYLFSRPLLQVDKQGHPQRLLHGIPVLAAAFMPPAMAFTSAFAIGAGYLLWLAKTIFRLRAQRDRFHIEIGILGATFLIALAVLILGLNIRSMDEKLFFSLYASAIGCAFILISLAINLTPKLPAKVAEAVLEVYATSTLNNVDCDKALHDLGVLMTQNRLYENPDLDLSTLAGHLGLTGHQLSELINTRLGKGFSRYLREQRVDAAKSMLLAEPSASVLSVGLSVGFTSQSNFYDAFREIAGMTPGNFRKITPPSAVK
jgi:AraC-like DNA-binding protein